MQESTFWGKAAHKTTAGDAPISPHVARIWTVATTNPGLTISLPLAAKWKVGGPPICVFNIGANAFTLSTADGTIAVAISRMAIALVMPNGTWHLKAGAWTGANVGAATVPLRKAFVAGGSSAAATTCEGFSELTGAWAAAAAIPNQKTEAASMNLERAAYVVGFSPITAGTSEKNDELTPLAAWVSRTSCPFTVGRGCGAAVLGTGYVFSGTTSAAVAAYTLDAWISKQPVPYLKTRATAAGIGHRAYIISGEPVPIVNLAHDPLMDAYWAIAYQPSTARHSIACFSIGHLLYAVGGYLDAPLTRFDNCDEYNPLLDTWTVRAPLGLGVRYRGAGISGNSRGYYCGGNGAADTAQASSASYNLDTWTSIAAMATARGEVANSGVAL